MVPLGTTSLEPPGRNMLCPTRQPAKPTSLPRRCSITGWEAIPWSETCQQAISLAPIKGKKEFYSNKRKRFSCNCCYEFQHLQLRKPYLRNVYQKHMKKRILILILKRFQLLSFNYYTRGIFLNLYMILKQKSFSNDIILCFHIVPPFLRIIFLLNFKGKNLYLKCYNVSNALADLLRRGVACS